MALKLVYPLKEGTYHRVRSFNDHKIGWKGIDDGCKVGTSLIAEGDGKTSHHQKISTGGGWNFRLNLTKYPGWFVWYAHCSTIPSNGKVFKAGQIIGKSGNTGGSTGPHLHHSLLYKGVPKDPDNPNVVKWIAEDKMADAKTIFRNVFITVMARWPTTSEINTYLKSSEKRPYTYVQKKFLSTRYVRKSAYDKLSANVTNLNAIIFQQATKLKTLAGQIKNLQEDLKHQIKLINESNGVMIDMDKKIITLKEELKACQEPTTPKKDPIKEFFIKIYKWLSTRYTEK